MLSIAQWISGYCYVVSVSGLVVLLPLVATDNCVDVSLFAIGYCYDLKDYAIFSLNYVIPNLKLCDQKSKIT